MAGAQKKYPGRVWASAAIPMQDTGVALDMLDHAVNKLGLMGVNLPGSIGPDPRIDAERLEPYYARVAELASPCSCIRPTPCFRICSTATTAPCTSASPRHRGQRCRITSHPVGPDGASSDFENRAVAHTAARCPTSRPHGQEHKARSCRSR